MSIQKRLLKIIRDDNYAAGFQSLGQYRTALLQAARGEVEPSAVQGEPMQCSACQGKGYRVAPLDIMLACPHCQGSGECSTPQPVKQRTAIQRKYKDWAIVRQSESAISIVSGDTYVTFSEGESDKRMPWLVDFLSSLLAGADPAPQPAQQQPANPDDTATAILGDRMYIAGLKAGWNYAEAGDQAGFDRSIENGHREIREAKQELAEQQPAPDVARLLQALEDAAQSLESISTGAGRDFMEGIPDIRSYARSRAMVARTALAAQGSQGGEV